MKIIFLLSVGFAVCACATTPGPAQNEASTSIVVAEDGAFSLTAIAEAALPEGKCGMILWTLDADAPSPILRYIAGEEAEISLNGTRVPLKLSETQGGGNFGVFEMQKFVSDSGYEATVTVNFGLGFDGGAYLERGLIAIDAESGWRVVAPSAGIAGCRAK